VTDRYTDEQAARVVHALFIEMQAVLGDDMPSRPWFSESRKQRKLVLDGVRRIREQPMLTAKDHHEAWRTGKRAQGWAYDPVKDPAEKTHPDMLPWNELSPEAKDKSVLFLAVVRALSGWLASMFVIALTAKSIPAGRWSCVCCGCPYSRCHCKCCCG
jgi:hypothetical protein